MAPVLSTCPGGFSLPRGAMALRDARCAREAHVATALVAFGKLRCTVARETEGERNKMHLYYLVLYAATFIRKAGMHAFWG